MGGRWSANYYTFFTVYLYIYQDEDHLGRSYSIIKNPAIAGVVDG
jgi:hypothetical protein